MACPDAGPSTRAGAGLTRFICVNCSATGRLSSRGLFQGSIGPPCAATSAPPRPASPPTSAIKRSTLRLGQATSWRGRVGRPVHRQRRRFVTNLQVQQHIYIYIYYHYVLYQNNAAGIAVKASRHYALGVGFETRHLQIFAFCIFLCTYKPCLYNVCTMYILV